MPLYAGTASDQLEPGVSDAATSCPAGDLTISGDYALPLERQWYDKHPGRFTGPHHDCPAVDIAITGKSEKAGTSRRRRILADHARHVGLAGRGARGAVGASFA